MEKNNYIIYSLSSSDKPDIIRYIGYTGRKTTDRVKEHIRESECRNPVGKKTHKENWIQKCLRLNESIIFNIIEDNISSDQIEEREIYYIKYFKEKGYPLVNATGGGDGQKHMSEETKRKISLSRKGIKLSQAHKDVLRLASTGKKQTEEVCVKMSKSLTGKNAGKTQSEEIKNHLRNISTTKKSVIQFSLNGGYQNTFSSLKEAFVTTGIYQTSIVKCCKNIYKNAGGFLWKFSDDTKEITSYDPTRTTKIILQYTLLNEFIAEYKSASHAERVTGIPNSNICACIKGKYKHAGGFIWKRAALPSDKIKINAISKILPKPVLQFSMDNVFLNEFKSINEAVKVTNGHRQHISECCKGSIRSSGGFIWKYKD